MNDKYNPRVVEKKWQRFWEDEALFEAQENLAKEKYYILEMFPYPSGKIHMVMSETIPWEMCADLSAQGFNVLHNGLGCFWTSRECSNTK